MAALHRRLSTFQEDHDWVCTKEIEQNLIHLYETDREKFHKEIAKMVQEHPSKFEILNVGATDGHDPHANEFTFEEFASHFIGHPGTISDKQLLAMIYADVEHDVGEVFYIEIPFQN